MWKKPIDGKSGSDKDIDDVDCSLINNNFYSIYYPISEDFLSQKRRWKFLEWFPRCYHPCTINSLYSRLLSIPPISNSLLPEDDSPSLKSNTSRDSLDNATGCAILLEDLPEHVHIEILKYVHPNERFKSISLVSRYWYNLVNRGIFWHEIRIHLLTSQYSMDSLRTFLYKASLYLSKFKARTHIKKICITATSTKPFDDRILMDLFPPVMQHVTVLDIGFYAFLSVILVEFFLKCFPNLEELNVEGTKAVENVAYSAFLRKGFPKLKKIFISYCAPFSLEDYRQFCGVKRPIEVLSVDGNAFLGNCAATYLATSSFVSTLTRLYLDGEGLDDFGFRTLTACKNLNLLSISFCENLTDVSLSCLKDLTNLEHLHLRKGREFTSEGLLELFKHSNENTGFFGRLRFLNLGECPAVDDDVIDKITESCPKLQSLNLAWDWAITDAGFTAIVERLNELRFLDVMGMNSITSSSLLYVPDLYLSKLRFLCIVQCPQFDEVSLEMLQLRKKDLIIANYHCYYNTVTISGNDVSFGERCDSRYTYAITDLLQPHQGFCCMSTLR
uniref:F-box domain-containing protein n=1 Tax=Setaria digitata TaxID=48799 RepID=A0A915PH06_9BILA